MTVDPSEVSPPKFHAYIINLASATQRWQHLREQVEAHAIPYTRVEAVLGRELPDPLPEFDEKRFQMLTGKRRNPGEIGCYLSHLQAMRAFLATEDSHALILEDDVTLPAGITTLLSRALAHREAWNLLRLTSSREGEFVTVAALDEIYQLAYNLRVLKNTGAYLIDRHAARACLEKMLPMCLPYDVALDREWDYGFKTACIVPFPIALEEFNSQISKAPRVRIYRATTFHLFHLWTWWQRRKVRRGYLKARG